MRYCSRRSCGYVRATCFNKSLSQNSILASKFTIKWNSDGKPKVVNRRSEFQIYKKSNLENAKQQSKASTWTNSTHAFLCSVGKGHVVLSTSARVQESPM